MTLDTYLSATSHQSTPARDRLVALLVEQPELTREQIAKELGLTYPAVVDVCRRAVTSGWVVSTWREGRAGRRGAYVYSLADTAPGAA